MCSPSVHSPHFHSLPVYIIPYIHILGPFLLVQTLAANSVNLYVEFKFEFEFSLFYEFEFKFEFDIVTFASSNLSSTSAKICQSKT